MVFLRLITRPKVSHELGNLLISLCNVASVSIVSEEHFTRKNSFVFGLGAETSHVEEFTLGTGMEVHTGQWRSQRDRTGGERRRFQRVSGL